MSGETQDNSCEMIRTTLSYAIESRIRVSSVVTSACNYIIRNRILNNLSRAACFVHLITLFMIIRGFDELHVLCIIYLDDKIKNWLHTCTWHWKFIIIYEFIKILKLLILVTHMYFLHKRQNDINDINVTVFGTPCIHSSLSI